MFQPEIATTWLTPAVVNAAARSRSTRSRRPIEDPGRETGLGFGQDARRGRRRHARRSVLETSAGVRRAPARPSSVRDVSVPTAPIRSRYCAVRRVGPRPDRSVDDDAVARDDDRDSAEAWPRPGTAGRRPAASTGASPSAGRRAATRSPRRRASTGRRRPGGRSSGGGRRRHRPPAGRRSGAAPTTTGSSAPCAEPRPRPHATSSDRRQRRARSRPPRWLGAICPAATAAAIAPMRQPAAAAHLSGPSRGP